MEAKSRTGKPSMRLAGLEFGKLTVIERDFSERPVGETHSYWKCKCSCGNELSIRGSRLKNGRTKSCGCLKKETKSGLTHGKTGTVEHMAWSSMRQRCLNKSSKAYRNYGGRGITICKRWEKFELFLADMGIKPEGMTLERRNNNRGYSKKNCVWASYNEQANNRRNNVVIEYKGIKMNLSQAAKEAGVSRATMTRWNRRFDGVVF